VVPGRAQVPRPRPVRDAAVYAITARCASGSAQNAYPLSYGTFSHS